MKPVPRWFASCFLALGCFMLLLLVFEVWSTRKFVARAARAQGTVIQLNAGAAHPQVQFRLPSGEEIDFPANGYISYLVGQPAKVLYLPGNPYQSARLDDFGDLWMGKVFHGMVGLAFVVVGLYKLILP